MCLAYSAGRLVLRRARPAPGPHDAREVPVLKGSPINASNTLNE